MFKWFWTIFSLGVPDRKEETRSPLRQSSFFSNQLDILKLEKGKIGFTSNNSLYFPKLPKRSGANHSLISCIHKSPLAFAARGKVTFLRHNEGNRRLLHAGYSQRNNNTPHTQQPAGVYKCNHPRCLTFPFLQERQTNYIFTATNEQRKIVDHLSCKSKNLIYLIQCNKCKCQYIAETKRQLNERFGEHCRSFLNHQQLNDPTPVSLHFNQAGHSINDVILIPLELIHSNRDAVRKAPEAHLIHKGNTLSPLAINRRDKAHWYMIPLSLLYQ